LRFGKPFLSDNLFTGMEESSIAAGNGKFTCLIVEDDKSFATMAAQVVRSEGGEATLVGSISDARAVVATRSFHVVLLDNHLPDGKGYGFFEQVERRNPSAPIVMITGMPDLGEAVALTRNGLFEYLTKPLSVEALAACLQRAKLRLATREPNIGAAELFGDSPAVREIMAQLQQAAKHRESTVLLTGETGVGKDLAARALHNLTFGEKEQPFVAVNCGALPAEIFEAELFGAERGAYTGADKARAGLVTAAGKGTLFLDEIAEVPLLMQVKLLRLLEAREYRALGSTQNQPFAGRFVAATNKNLSAEVKAGRFREDLLYRLDVFSIELPPLRQRRSDIPKLAESLLAQLAQKYGRKKPLLKAEDLAALNNHAFPGNVRELRNVLERSLLKTDSENKWLVMDLNWLNRGVAKPVTPSADELPIERELTPIEAQEYRLIRETLNQTNGGIRRAATKLGMSPQALLRRLEKWPELRGTKESV
jgi:two-component system, NtrC family, response regulator AtoC